MGYFIFAKNLDKIQYEKLNHNIHSLVFEERYKRNLKPDSYDGDVIKYVDVELRQFITKEKLKDYINDIKNRFNLFINNNKNYPYIEKYVNYYNVLNNLDIDSVSFPLTSTLEEYLENKGLPSLNILQLFN